MILEFGVIFKGCMSIVYLIVIFYIRFIILFKYWGDGDIDKVIIGIVVEVEEVIYFWKFFFNSSV